jgi:predicted RND superfamily exporter protein
MADVPHHEFRETKTLRFARFVTRNRFPVALFLIFSTLFFFYPILNMITTTMGLPLPGPIVRVDTKARDLFPDHPYIHAQDKFAKMFGGSSLVAIAVTVNEGTIFNPASLQKIREVTRRLDGVGFDSQTDARDEMRDQLEEDESLSLEEIRDILDRHFPPYPVNHNQINSIADSSARVVQIEASGDITTLVLMEKVPETQEEANALRAVVLQNPPIIYGRLVSTDEKGALISAGFVTDRLANRETYMSVFNHVQQIKADLARS